MTATKQMDGLGNTGPTRAYVFWFSAWVALCLTGCIRPTEPVQEDYSDRAQYTLVLGIGGILYTVRADGSAPVTIGDGLNPQISQSGERLAFRKVLFDDLFVYDFSSGVTHQVLFETNWDRYAWSPSNSQIVYSGPKVPSGYTVRIVDVASGNVTPLTDTIAGSQRFPHWLPDSVTIVYIQWPGRAAAAALGVYSLEDGTQSELPYTPSYIEWSPKGNKYLMLDRLCAWPFGALIKDLPTVVPGVSGGKWFPDGESLLLRTYAPDLGFYSYDVAAETATRIHSDTVNGFEMTISPDGKLIAYIPIPNDHLVVMDADGGRVASFTIPGATGSYNELQFVGDYSW